MKTQFIALLFTATIFQTVAQPPVPEGRRENVEAVKIAFITRELNLSPEEAQKFWPVYNQFQNEMDALRKDKRDDKREIKRGLEQMTDEEIAKSVDEVIINEQRELDVKKKYHAEFKKVLSIRKVAQLYRAEQEFKKEVLRRMREEGRPKQPMQPRN